MNELKFDELLKTLVCEMSRISIHKEQITNKTRFVEDLGFDSLEMIQMLVMIEQDLGITFNGDDLMLENMEDYGALSSIIKQKLQIINTITLN